MDDNEERIKVDFNRLVNEKSPYLLQHAYNPVDWYPWGEEAFQRAGEDDKPIFLSIGYATCHWCHVMAHESFEDKEVASLLNKYFIAIKVDREERPDIDQVYMTFCQALSGGGGWPLSVFMTPEKKPFFAGTYFPKERRMGMSGFIELLTKIAELWEKDRRRIVQSSEDVTNVIQSHVNRTSSVVSMDMGTLKSAYDKLLGNFDETRGGFGSAPKFPTPHNLSFLLRWYGRSNEKTALDMVEKTLGAMRNGGIFDQIGFGFHRYSVDEKWLVPHFEKMLYDQALLAIAYIEAYQVTGNAGYAKVAKEVFNYVIRDMTSPDGGFYSAEDADSEGKEGLFYIWRQKEIKEHLGERLGDVFCRFYGISPSGNFEDGHNIPHITIPLDAFAEQEGLEPAQLENQFEDARKRLFEIRSRRVHPLKDDKIITSWNGLMIAALAKGYMAFGDKRYSDAAKKAADFILYKLRNNDGRIFRRYRNGDVAYPGYLDDYAFFVWGLIELYEAGFEVRYFQEAITINKAMVELFRDDKDGGFYFSGKGNEMLITTGKEIYDGALPSGNSVAALNLFRLGRMTGNSNLEKMGEQLIKAFSSQVAPYPQASTHFMMALDFMVGPGKEIVISGDSHNEVTRTMITVIHRIFLPNKVVLLRQNGEEGRKLSSLSPFTKTLLPVNQDPVVYVCEQYTCNLPITNVSDLKKNLEKKDD
ncbi:MAG: thioredoxin domain-containing protein [Thermodesulfobacteriota bacterium]|nr:thioredoxin domain-containing protein [Thermodesulfobacteriota bacterium]